MSDGVKRAMSLRYNQKKVLEEIATLPQEIISHIFKYVPYDIQYGKVEVKYREQKLCKIKKPCKIKQTIWHEII